MHSIYGKMQEFATVSQICEFCISHDSSAKNVQLPVLQV